MVNFGALDTVPPKFADRNLHVHNPQVTLMRTTPDENRQIGKFIAENVNYAGVVTRLLQPILPVFFAIQFAFLYDGWRNRFSLEQVYIGGAIAAFGLLLLAAFAATFAGTLSTMIDERGCRRRVDRSEPRAG